MPKHDEGNLTQARLDSSSADDICYDHFSTGPLASSAMAFHTLGTSTPLATVLSYLSTNAPTLADTKKSLIVLAGRGRRHGTLAPEIEAAASGEIAGILSTSGVSPSTGAEMRKTMGDIVTAIVIGVPREASYLVVQAAMAKKQPMGV